MSQWQEGNEAVVLVGENYFLQDTQETQSNELKIDAETRIFKNLCGQENEHFATRLINHGAKDHKRLGIGVKHFKSIG